MIECPYCGADADEPARFCDRCGERLGGEAGERDGFLQRTSIQYLQGVRHGARPLDPSSEYHEDLQRDVRDGVEDFSHLAAIETLDLAALLEVDETDLGAFDRDRSPDADLSEIERRTLGLAVVLGLLDDAYDGSTLDELRALGADGTE